MCSESRKEHILFYESFPQPQHYKQKKMYKEKRTFCIQVRQPSFLASMTQLARIEWLPQSVSCCRVRRETHRQGNLWKTVPSLALTLLLDRVNWAPLLFMPLAGGAPASNLKVLLLHSTSDRVDHVTNTLSLISSLTI